MLYLKPFVALQLELHVAIMDTHSFFLFFFCRISAALLANSLSSILPREL